MIVVDRIEGDRAVLEVEGETVEVPRCVLPEGAGEGTVLRFLAEPADAQGLAESQARIERLAARSKLPDDIEL